MLAVSVPAEVLQYIQALKWPVLIAGVLFFERKVIANFLRRIREGTAKFGSAEISWKSDVQEVAERADEYIAQAVQPPAGPERVAPKEQKAEEKVGTDAGVGTDRAWVTVIPRTTGTTDWAPIDRQVVTDPTGAVISAWEKLAERIIGRAYIEKANVSQREARDVVTVAARLGVPSDAVGILRDLRALRNRVAHAQSQITSHDALEYVQTVKRVADQMSPGS
jgi:hypothetical protein